MTQRRPDAAPRRHDASARCVARLVGQFRAQRPMRAGSLLVTVFGDAIAPHGGTVWMGSLIRALDSLGVNQRLVRTSIFRLASDGWFTSQQIGRRSYYSLTDAGRRRFDEASRHIYAEPRKQWNGEWCLVLLAAVPATEREQMRKALGWLGFGSFSPNLLAHPAADRAVVEEQLQRFSASDKLLVFDASIAGGRERHLRLLVSDAWALDELGRRYAGFVDRFRPAFQAMRRSTDPDPALAFSLRTLLVHEYRKIVLRDPQLPEALLPHDWSGVAAYQLCRNLYRLLAAASERFLTAHMETAEGPLPPAEPDFFRRFGGLQTDGGSAPVAATS